MAGRGRGAGRGQMTFNVQAIGIGRGETLPPPTLQPPPLFPALDFKPVPLQTGEEVEYMLALKQELRGAMKSLPYYIKPAAPKKDVERYSDKYQTSGPVDNAIDWHPDWSLSGLGLKIKNQLRIVCCGSVRLLISYSCSFELFLSMFRQSHIIHPKTKQRVPLDTRRFIKKLEKPGEKKEEEVSSEEEEEKKEEEEEKEKKEESLREEEGNTEAGACETDYIMSYFDNGEDFGGDSDDNMDEATY
ncbi:hypothetical protein GDO81_014770 [Engystomops pustulosus]|uniref:DNA-directed RNA polymerase III subunit n=1 Tax=Engystomops pustulosus TaxID=76066 RepID=A0AAV7AEU9_ENGPU|nr:hypothetical protein GDO81_014770 [Engystomops pustulosus]